MRYAIFENYEQGKPPIGWVEISDDVLPAVVNSCAIVPAIAFKDGEWITEVFGMIRRENVDTRRSVIDELRKNEHE